MMRTSILLVFALLLGTAAAKAPLKGGQAPGWYRFKVGDFEVTALSDGTGDFPMADMLVNTTPDKIKAAFAAAHLKSPVETSVNAFLVNTGTKLVLIDTGVGKALGPTLGKLAANLRASGYQPAQVDEIYLTHLHTDHAGGLTVDNKAVFANAIVRAAKGDTAFFLDPAILAKATGDDKKNLELVHAAFKPYTAKLKPFDGADVELVPGVHALAAPGHTTGHTIYAIESKGEKMVFWGDLMHVAAMQFADPEVALKFDTDSKPAIAQRKKVFAELAAKGYLIGAAHVSFPGVGHLRTEGKGYVWIPMNYTRN